MAKPRQSSFRRILVTRILLLFVPALLLGEIVALNKARSSLLKTARQNLTESATFKGERIAQAITTLQTHLLIVSQTNTIQSGSSEEVQEYLTYLTKKSPTQVECLQLTHLPSGKIFASTCGNQQINPSTLSFPEQGEKIVMEQIFPPKPGTTGQKNPQDQLRLMVSTPVDRTTGSAQYVLSIQSAAYTQTKHQPGSLTGATLVIGENGMVLAHPSAELVGSNIKQHPDAAELEYIVKNAIAGETNSINLPSQRGKELIVGYTAIDNPITTEPGQKWIILAVTTVDNALLGLEELKLLLIVLTVGLTGASLLALLYLAPYLANPLEELRDYALNLHSHHAAQPVPRNFKIREFNQLALAIDQMVERLKAWAEELEMAWKEAKNANQIKTQFLATTSHELRNPLNVIINCVRVVHDGLCDNREEEIEFLKRADDTAIHLLGIINELLDISKIEAGKLSVVSVPIDFRQILLEVINLQSVNVQQKGLQLKTDLGTDLIPVKADPAKLKQVLINVIGNATKFTDQGSIKISTIISQDIGQPYQVIVSVTDTGLGIEPAQQHKLFRPFVMLDGGSSRKVQGTGLGLAISRNLIELMGGSITLESAGINQGTTVKITLPLIDPSLLTTVDTVVVKQMKSYPIHGQEIVPESHEMNGSGKPGLDSESCELSYAVLQLVKSPRSEDKEISQESRE
ncbi:ATP-binding protein [Nodularia chucula]|uniref:ATP-binding protein n=1 Tax=Nodularia chucula TaxID=3093667 RepID=UPI0039C63789